MFIKTQKFLVLGVSKSGYAVSKYLLSNGVKCYIFDDSLSNKVTENISELLLMGAEEVKKENVLEILNTIDVLIISPGVPINHEIAVNAKNLGKRIIGEFEFGLLQFFPPLVAVTGTNGKTTTVSLIDYILSKTDKKHIAVGNIGVPITSVLESTDKDTVLVSEISSFQLESINICPHIACILNIAPDHLERHYSMDNYVFLKKKIFKSQKESEYTVLNYDDEKVRAFKSETKGKVVFVSVREKVDGAYFLDGKLYYKDEYIIDSETLSLKGEHNLYNSLFALAVCKLLGINTPEIVSGLQTFCGVKHRLEKVTEKNGITFYNDSKSTNTASCINAIEFMKEPFILILGGSEKGEEYVNLFSKIKDSLCIHVVITGASKYNMLKAAREVGVNNLTVTEDFDLALKVAFMSAKEGESVLFSPACASFDKFNGYEERGEAFIKAVKNFVEE